MQSLEPPQQARPPRQGSRGFPRLGSVDESQACQPGPSSCPPERGVLTTLPGPGDASASDASGWTGSGLDELTTTAQHHHAQVKIWTPRTAIAADAPVAEPHMVSTGATQTLPRAR